MRINKRQAIDMTFIDLNYASGLETNLAMYDNCYGKPNIVSGKYPQHKHFCNAKAQKVIDFCTQRKIAYHIKDKTITEE